MDERDAREMRCEHEQDGGAYVLGALTPAERAAYERHLTVCPVCREAVAEIAVLPSLLGRLDPASGARPSPGSAPAGSSPRSGAVPPRPAPAPPPGSVPRSRRSRVIVLVAAAVVLIAGGALGAVLAHGRSSVRPAVPPGRTVAMRPLDDDLPISAELTLYPWPAPSPGASAPGSPPPAIVGTRIDLVCAYGRSARYRGAYRVRLIARGAGGATEQVGTWVAVPGRRFGMSGVAHVGMDRLRRVELVRDDGTVLLAYDMP